MTIIQLVAGANSEGYSHALTKVFFIDQTLKAPVKSALCQFRKKISYLFFRDCFQRLIDDLQNESVTFKNKRIYAVDGQQWTLPKTKDIVKHGFSGRAVSRYRDTYMPRGYFTHLYDVLNGTTKGFTFHSSLNEHRDAEVLLPKVEKGSLVLYDRLFFSESLVHQHFEQGIYFIMRLRRNANKAVARFIASEKNIATIVVGSRRVKVMKVRLKNSHETILFATNLPWSWCKPNRIAKLYRMRWEVETSFKEITGLTKGEQWHSTTYNGILQEIYARLWLINFTKSVMNKAGQKPLNPEKETYKKANFKLIFNFIAQEIYKFWHQFSYLIAHVRILIKQTTERRKKCSRSYRRELKSPASPYSRNNTGWYWELLKT